MLSTIFMCSNQRVAYFIHKLLTRHKVNKIPSNHLSISGKIGVEKCDKTIC